MFFKRIPLILLSLLMISGPMKAHAQELELRHFKLRPLGCVVLRAGDSCRLIVKVEWELNQAADVSLLHDSQPLAIWQQQAEGKGSVAVELKQTSQFHLQANGQVLATQNVRLSSQESNQYRRRLHSDWSFF